jgi:cation transport ATPase
MNALVIICLAIAALATVLLLRRKNPAHEEIPRPHKSDQEASQRLVDLIDILFALVLGLPVLIGEDVFLHPGSHGAPVMLAYITGYYVVVRSYVDWHIAMEDAPYWIRTSAGRTWELRRVYVDFLIVIAYVMMFLSTRPLLKSPGADIGLFLSVVAVIPVLYLAWGALRRMAYGGGHEYLARTMTKAAVALFAVWGAYRFSREHGSWLGGHGTLRNDIAITVSLIIVLAYRRANWHEMRIPGKAT